MSFTRIPNKVIDELRLNPYQFQILSIIVRKTDGWCKIEDGISLSQFEKLVSFKRPKLVSTLKELEEMLLIVKTKQQKENGGNSFNLYKIHHTLVTENNKGSNSELQGVVTEDYKQKKLLTKETKTSKVHPLLEKHKNENKGVGKTELSYLNDFIAYRKTIKKSLNTIAPLKAYWIALKALHELGYDINDCVKQMKSNEWQTLKIEYIHKDSNKNKVKDSNDDWSERK